MFAKWLRKDLAGCCGGRFSLETQQRSWPAQASAHRVSAIRLHFEAPDAPWIEVFILDISETGLCLNVGALAVPELFGVSFTPCGSIMRVCRRVWRRGELLGARFVTARELRLRDQKYVDPRCQKAKPLPAR